jgi:MYXO-CTERM domain-containing protein
MEAASPARLYAALVGAFLLLLGIAGFFYSASFGAPGSVEAALGVLRVDAWINLLHVLTGALGLLMAGFASRRYALWIGALYTVVAIWGFAIGAGDAILGFLPASGGDDTLHLAVGLLGLAAAAGTPRRESRSEPRAEPAG